jgi:hypothetical protein
MGPVMERDDWSDRVLSIAADRFECRLVAEISGLRRDLLQELHASLAEIRKELADTRVELLRWSFVFWIGQLAAVAAILGLMLGRPGS